MSRSLIGRECLELVLLASACDGFTDWLASHRNEIVGRLLEGYERERQAGAGADGEP